MFFSLFTGNVVLEFVNQFHFTFGLKGWQQKRAAAIVIEKTEWVEKYTELEAIAIIVRLPALSVLNCETKERQGKCTVDQFPFW